MSEEILLSKDLLGRGVNPSEVLTNLTEFIVSRHIQLIGGDHIPLDQTIELALVEQRKQLDNSTALPTQPEQEQSAKTFTSASSRLVDVCLNATGSFWMLDAFRRFRILDEYQQRVDETLFQLAVNLAGTVPFSTLYENLGRSISEIHFWFICHFHPLLRSRPSGTGQKRLQQ